MAEFFDSLAQDWRGEAGERIWTASEEGLSVAAHRNLAGHVLLTFTLWEKDSWDEHERKNLWSVRAVVKVEPGEEMTQVAAGVRRLLDRL